jgi:hypothetical protein
MNAQQCSYAGGDHHLIFWGYCYDIHTHHRITLCPSIDLYFVVVVIKTSLDKKDEMDVVLF